MRSNAIAALAIASSDSSASNALRHRSAMRDVNHAGRIRNTNGCMRPVKSSRVPCAAGIQNIIAINASARIAIALASRLRSRVSVKMIRPT
jgi:hypothetical protein